MENANQSRLVVRRSSEWMNRARSFKIMVDGQQAGTVKNGQSEDIAIASGMHKLFCKVDWCSSREVEIQAKPGETTYLFVKSGMKYYWYFMIPLLIVLVLNFYLTFKHSPKPFWFDILLGIVGLSAAGYMMYYTLFNRKDNLVMGEDEKGIFGN